MIKIDLNEAIRALSGNQQLFVELTQIFFEDAPKLLNDLGRELREGNLHQSRQLAHSIKGLISTFYVPEADDLMRKIELELARGEIGAVRDHLLPLTSNCVDQMITQFDSNGWLDRSNS